jgi:broad specificity phosphatase PhoE
VTKIILVRHGQSRDNKDDIIQGWRDSELTDEGKRQAATVFERIDGNPDMVFCSDLKRCYQTAQIIHENLPEIPLMVDWRLRERSFGSAEGKHRDEIDFDELFKSEDMESPYDSEPKYNLRERLKSFLRDTESFNCQTILIVCHGGVLNNVGYLLDTNYEHERHENVAIVSYDLDYDDTRLLPGKVNYWSHPHG